MMEADENAAEGRQEHGCSGGKWSAANVGVSTLIKLWNNLGASLPDEGGARVLS